MTQIIDDLLTNYLDEFIEARLKDVLENAFTDPKTHQQHWRGAVRVDEFKLELEGWNIPDSDEDPDHEFTHDQIINRLKELRIIRIWQMGNGKRMMQLGKAGRKWMWNESRPDFSVPPPGHQPKHTPKAKAQPKEMIQRDPKWT